LGEKTLLYSSLLAVQPHLSPEWSINVAIVMIICNLVAIAIGYYAIPKQNRGKGPGLPVAMPDVFTGFGIPELLATTSFGHILGAGVILGLGGAGVL
jgi:photosystem I subunit 10